MSTPWQYEFKDLKSRLKHAWETRVLADCSFLVRGDEVKGHSFIIGLTSPILLKELEDAGSNKFKIAISDVEPDIFNAMLKYIYTDSAEITSSDFAYKLGEAARAYQLPHLEKECYNYITTTLTPQNVLRGYELALCTKDDEMAKKCEEIITTNTKEVLDDASFEKACIDTVGAVFSLEPLTIDNEMELLKAIDRYVKNSESKSGPDCDDTTIRSVLGKIRFLTLTPEEFAVGYVGTSVLSEGDACAVLANLASAKSGVPMPQGFSTRKDWRTIFIAPVVVSEAKFKFGVQDFINFSKKSDYAWSRAVMVQNLPWKVRVHIDTKDDVKYVDCFLFCNEEDDEHTWSCKAEVKWSLLSPEMDVKTFTTTFTNQNKKLCYARGYDKFIKVEDAINPEKNYLQDGALIFEVSIKAEQPIMEPGKPTPRDEPCE